MKSLFVLLAVLTSAWAQASPSPLETCQDHLQYYYVVGRGVVEPICRQNSSPQFVQCMIDQSSKTNLHITDVVPSCSRQVRVTSVFNSCEARLQIQTSMNDELAVQACQYDSSLLMQGCIVDLVQKAKFHPEHALQYCHFAGYYYRRQMARFKVCVIDQARFGGGAEAIAQRCHEDILGIRRLERPAPQAPIESRSNPNAGTSPTRPQTPAQKQTGGVPSKVPTPAEIKVQESSKPKVVDRPIRSESNSNVESLPID
ncbi:MAG: hypothetical protein ACK5Y2_12470 [Bdellovibrionales bacterium]